MVQDLVRDDRNRINSTSVILNSFQHLRGSGFSGLRVFVTSRFAFRKTIMAEALA